MPQTKPIIEFLHTADVHVGTFETLLEPHAADMGLRHEVRADWLARAQQEGVSAELHSEVRQHLTGAAERAAVVVCTCSTLGPIADEVAQVRPSVFRIDRPMMEAAARIGGTCLVAVCVEATIRPTTDLLAEVCWPGEAAYEIALCADAWPYFEAGDTRRYAQTIARRVKERLAGLSAARCVILAQGSMAVAEPLLADADLPILCSPQLAAEEAVARIRRTER